MLSTQALTIRPAVQPVSLAQSTTATSVAVDTAGFGVVRFVLAVGVVTGVGISAFKIRGSLDGSTGWVDVPGATLAAFPGATDDGKRYAIEINLRDASIRRYLDVVLTTNGTTGTGLYGVDAILGDPTILPNTAAERGFSGEVLV